jgi:hypothetical protein
LAFYPNGRKLLRVYENRVLLGVFGPKGDEMTGGRRKMQNEELQNLYSLRDIIVVIK